MMSSPGSQEGEATESTGEQTIWHPARQWLEEDDEHDIDYHPALEESEEGDAWEEMSVEDEDFDVGARSGEDKSWCSGLKKMELTYRACYRQPAH